MLSKFAQTVIAIAVIGGVGYGASYMADSPMIDNALNKLNEKSAQIQETQKQKELIAEQKKQESDVREREEQLAKQQAERDAAVKLQEEQAIVAKRKAIAENEAIQKQAAIEQAKQQEAKIVSKQQETAPLPELVKLHIIESAKPANQNPQPSDNAMAKLLNQTK